MVNVLYYIEELLPTLKPVGSWEEYLAEKGKKDESKEKKEQLPNPPTMQAQPSSQQPPKELRTEEKILSNLPELLTLDREL